MLHPNSPAQMGYAFPAEWAPHTATWLSWPHKEASWPGKLASIYPVYAEFVRLLSEVEQVHINVCDAGMQARTAQMLRDAGARMSQVLLHIHPTNDAWCRDHGPAFVVNPRAPQPKALVKWKYNAWGEKYPPHDLDNEIPYHIARFLELPVFEPGIVMEGGSIEVNGRGTLMTTEACLLNPNRNPQLSRQEIESYLKAYYGQTRVLWLKDGIVGDDTDGHIDDLTRFVDPETVVTVVESNPDDENYEVLQENLDLLRGFTLENGHPLRIIELPMPDPVWYEGQRLPASYANFYIANGLVVVPVYRCPQDGLALEILASCFPDRRVVGLDSTDLIWGLGSFHCLSQQEPAADGMS
ncbi:MAG: agmatine deiminase family protein [Bacteroidia bacterium]|nr:agmatine deiminase family protein [Bacteroidia bacterium]